jgi:AcrR family transcriptional regulator
MRDGTATRTRIEDQALRLFVDKGVDGTTIRDIAQAARVAEGALYRHYTGKDDLVWRLFAVHYASFAERLGALAAAERGTRAKIAAMVRGFCALFESDPVLFRFLLVVQHGQLAKVTAQTATPIETVRHVIAAGMKAGDIPAGDSNLATALVIGLVLQPATFAVYGRIAPPLSPLAPQLADAAWRVLAREG